MFVGHSNLNVRKVCQQTKFTIQRNSNTHQPLTISSERLQKTYNILKNSSSPNPFINDPGIRCLQNQLKAIGKNIPGSDFERRSLQHEMKALMVHFGLPAFFITINPADIHHPLVLHYAGKQINLDAPFDDNWLTKEE
jgi:hypothetical protein